ncbi:hypothetical protein K3727_07645 [Rhodobacteraceae bacterium M382]|nr:hypothetical protein K3727_07645 [Rhodobacteraceae bacterium M382]
MKISKLVLATMCTLGVSAGACLAEMQVALKGGWNGKTIPAGQHCGFQGGKGMSPPMSVSNLPGGTVWVYIEFNDRDYRPLSRKGGHGVIGYPAKGSKANVVSVPEKSENLPGGAKVIKPARSSGKYASKGYLAPCSGGKGNRYFADVKAISAQGKVLERAQIELGRY